MSISIDKNADPIFFFNLTIPLEDKMQKVLLFSTVGDWCGSSKMATVLHESRQRYGLENTENFKI